MSLWSTEFVFSNQRRHWLARHGLFWLTWALFFTIIYGFLPAAYLMQRGVVWSTAFPRGFTISSIESVLFMPTHMLMTYGLIYWLIPRYLYPGRYGWLLVNILVLGLLTSLTSAMLAEYLVNPLRLQTGGPKVVSSFSFAIIAGMRGGITVGGFAASIKLAKDWYLKQQAYQQIGREKLKAELQLLKAQIHPHFLFNTLNNLYALTLRQSEQSPAVVLKLSELLSYMLYDCNAAEVPLDKEIQFMRNYIGLEQLRYGDRLDMSVTISSNYPQQTIAPLLLIPFLENAFKHGTSEQLEQAWMHVDLTVQEETLKFKLINSRETTEHEADYVGGIGLENVKKRLQLIYADRYSLHITAEDETFMVVLTLALSPLTGAAVSTPQLQEAH
ncbi:histidine kinase [Fibrella sp. HMF5335]|uniref:Histidine kinase n=1 Tax=Fibrella rubiginis TaxID=2817060 RepID=A0A939K3Q5_9BACT|nr:histidine kinase [Fibrella rubiginis]MBO0935873.1 histidine kinase [Fibrella rubiginis]